MGIRFARPGKTPFFIYPKGGDVFKMALIRNGKFIGWRERGSRFRTRDDACEARDAAGLADVEIGEII